MSKKNTFTISDIDDRKSKLEVYLGAKNKQFLVTIIFFSKYKEEITVNRPYFHVVTRHTKQVFDLLCYSEKTRDEQGIPRFENVRNVFRMLSGGKTERRHQHEKRLCYHAIGRDGDHEYTIDLTK